MTTQKRKKPTAVMTYDSLDQLVFDVCDVIEAAETVDGNIHLGTEHIRDVMAGLLSGYGVAFIPDPE